MKNIVIKNVSIVNEGTTTNGDVWIRDTRIEKIGPQLDPSMRIEEIDGTGQTLIPGVIDDQVHFREPGLTQKATIYTEAKAAVRGGVTSFMEMPNTNPPAFTHALLEQKYDIAKHHALANYSFFMGTSNDNIEEVLRTNDKKNDICGVKIFMGSSTGNLLVENPILLERIFEGSEVLIATHCEEERLIKHNLAKAASENRKLTAADHPIIEMKKYVLNLLLERCKWPKNLVLDCIFYTLPPLKNCNSLATCCHSKKKELHQKYAYIICTLHPTIMQV